MVVFNFANIKYIVEEFNIICDWIYKNVYSIHKYINI